MISWRSRHGSRPWNKTRIQLWKRLHRTGHEGRKQLMKRRWLVDAPGVKFRAIRMFCVMLLCALGMGGLAQAQVALPGSADDAPMSAVRIQSDQDIKTYKAIFDAQAKADWATADKHIKRLKDRVLLGHVLYERYMHPTAYRTSY